MQQSGPGKTGLWVGVILMVIGVVGGIALIVVGAKSVVDTVNGFQRVNVRTGGVVSFSKAARYNTNVDSLKPVDGVHHRLGPDHDQGDPRPPRQWPRRPRALPFPGRLLPCID